MSATEIAAIDPRGPGRAHDSSVKDGAPEGTCAIGWIAVTVRDPNRFPWEAAPPGDDDEEPPKSFRDL